MAGTLTQMEKRGALAVVILVVLGTVAVYVAMQLLPQPLKVPSRGFGADSHQIQAVVNSPATVERAYLKMHAGAIRQGSVPSEMLNDQRAVDYIDGFIGGDDSRFSLRLVGDFPAKSVIAINLAGVQPDLPPDTNCFFFAGANSGELVQKPSPLLNKGLNIAGWKLDDYGRGHSEASRFQPDWAEMVLDHDASTMMIVCNSHDNFSRESGAASTVEFPELTLIVEGQDRVPAVETGHTIEGRVDLHVLAGESISSPRPGLFSLEPAWNSAVGENDRASQVEAKWFVKDDSSPVGVTRYGSPPSAEKTIMGAQFRVPGRWTQVESVSGQSQSQMLAAVGGGILGFGLGLLAPIGAYLWKTIPTKSSKREGVGGDRNNR